MDLQTVAELAQPAARKIVLLVLDGLGGLPREPGGPTELEAARTPCLDDLARTGSLGLHHPVAPGITPGSGPGHLSLFGYDPLRYVTGRGVLEALGIRFDLRETDIAARGNLCWVDQRGRLTDRRAGRIASSAAVPLTERLNQIDLPGVTCLVRHVSEHRFVLVIRSEGSGAGRLETDVRGTDPGHEGVPPRDPEPKTEGARRAAELLGTWVNRAAQSLAGEAGANMVLLRGISGRPRWPLFPDVFGMKARAVAAYPMYRGVARLVGMEAVEAPDRADALLHGLKDALPENDFVFLHYKAPDKAGEDGDFDRKVATIEAIDPVAGDIAGVLGDGVLLVTGDHSTPAVMRGHSWHPVPFLLHGGGLPGERRAGGFGEAVCARGIHGTVRGWDLMRLAAARAGGLKKYGA